MSDFRSPINPATIKFSYNGEIRKISAISSYNEMIDTIQQVYNFKPCSFLIKYVDEDEDKITVSNQEDYVVALESFAGKTPKFVIEEKQFGMNSEYSIISEQDDTQSRSDQNQWLTMTKVQSNYEVKQKDIDEEEVSPKRNLETSFSHSSDDELIQEKHSEAIQPIKSPIKKVEDNQEEKKSAQPVQIKKLPIHTNYICDGCGVSPIVGVRYKCTVLEDFDLCEACERKNGHKHPLMKLKTNDDFNKFIQHLVDVYNFDESENDQNDVANQDILNPKVIDSDKITTTPKYVDLITDNTLTNYQSELINFMPNEMYTISIGSGNLFLSCTLKNIGLIRWPEEFLIGLIQTSNNALNIHSKSELIRSELITSQVDPNGILTLNTEIVNPKMTGKFTYLLTLMTPDGSRFGCPFPYTFNVNVGYQAKNPYKPWKISKWNPFHSFRTGFGNKGMFSKQMCKKKMSKAANYNQWSNRFRSNK